MYQHCRKVHVGVLESVLCREVISTVSFNRGSNVVHSYMYVRVVGIEAT